MIAFAATALGSINIVEVALTPCQNTPDVFVPFYTHGIQQAASSHLRDLIIRDEVKLNEVGIHLPSRSSLQ